jgi:hypothetical protein
MSGVILEDGVQWEHCNVCGIEGFGPLFSLEQGDGYIRI